MSVVGKDEGIKHGTPGGYKQHLHRQIEPCDDCREANRAARAAARQKAQQQQALIKAAQKARMVERMYVRPYSPHPPGWQDPAWGEPVAGGELAVGDVLVHIGREYRIDRFEPYKGSLDNVLGKGARVACSGPTWGLPISLDRTYRIRPREGR